MEFLDILLLGVVIIALCVMGMGRFLKSRTPQQAWGFKDVVKDPSYWDQSVHALHKAEQAVQAAKSWNDATVDRAVTAYLFEINRSQDAWIEQRQLEGLESRTHRRVLELLSGTTPYQKWVTPTAENDPPEAPIERACELLGYRPPTEAIPLLAPFLEDVNSSVRKSVASCLGKTGRPAAVPYLKRALGDPDSLVKGAALEGLSWAKQTKMLAPEVTEALFDDVLNLAKKDEFGCDAPGTLFTLYPKRAEEHFLSAKFRPDSPTLHRVLAMLRVRGVIIPRERLLELISQLREGEVRYPKDQLLGEALEQLGSHRNPDDLKLFETLQAHPERVVATGASSALLPWHGLGGFAERLEDREDRSGYASLTRPQQLYSTVLRLDGEINNGGLDQYFVNSSGDEWRDALEGLKAMNATTRAEILEEAAAKFGKNGPSTNRRPRQKQLAAIARADENAFEALDERYYDVKEPIEVSANRYVLANAEAFR